MGVDELDVLDDLVYLERVNLVVLAQVVDPDHGVKTGRNEVQGLSWVFLKRSYGLTYGIEGVDAVLLGAALPHSQSAQLTPHHERQKFTVEENIEADVVWRH